jgi:hypothetical protein
MVQPAPFKHSPPPLLSAAIWFSCSTDGTVTEIHRSLTTREMKPATCLAGSRPLVVLAAANDICGHIYWGTIQDFDGNSRPQSAAVHIGA